MEGLAPAVQVHLHQKGLPAGVGVEGPEPDIVLDPDQAMDVGADLLSSDTHFSSVDGLAWILVSRSPTWSTPIHYLRPARPRLRRLVGPFADRFTAPDHQGYSEGLGNHMQNIGQSLTQDMGAPEWVEGMILLPFLVVLLIFGLRELLLWAVAQRAGERRCTATPGGGRAASWRSYSA